jgi:Na+/proline symporter
MALSSIDIAIMAIYFLAMIGIGVAVTKRASKNLDSYFLAGNRIPWYILGASNASAMFDITGTMWLVYNIVVYGMKGAYLPWLWPTFNQVVFMVFLAVWLRRSNVLTGAEWITTRFGAGRSGELCRIMVTVFALVLTVLLIAYAFAGIGKFAKIFLPWDFSAETYALIIMLVTSIYVVLGGMISVIITDLAQFVIMALCSFAIAWIAVSSVPLADLNAIVPDGWYGLMIESQLNLDWSKTIPEITKNVAEDGYSLFGCFFMAMLIKGLLVSIAGPTPNYDMQRILAAKSPREAGLMSGVVSVALLPRWFMIGGIALIGAVMVSRQLGDPALASQWVNKGKIDLEMLLPLVMRDYIPAGLLGVLLAGLFAAFMSTFSATLNAGAAYLVNDVYKRYLVKERSDRHYVFASYGATLAVLIVGVSLGLVADSINQVTQIIVNGLWGGYAAANVLKWYWWRFNGYGYFWGMLVGMLVAASQPAFAPEWHPLWWTPVVMAAGTVASVVGSLLTPADDESTLKSFYRSVRPWGFWGPIHEVVIRDDPSFQKNRDFWRDLSNIAVAIVWQFQLVLIPLFLIFQRWQALWIGIAVFVITSIFLKYRWYNHLEPGSSPPGGTPEASASKGPATASGEAGG